jgi:hypothetical protein
VTRFDEVKLHKKNKKMNKRIILCLLFALQYNAIFAQWKNTNNKGIIDIAAQYDGQLIMVKQSGNIVKSDGNQVIELKCTNGYKVAANYGKIAYLDTIGGMHIWNPTKQTWGETLASVCSNITISDKGAIWVTYVDGMVYKYENDNWKRMPAKSIVKMAANGLKVYAINKQGQLLQWKENDWVRANGSGIAELSVTNFGEPWIIDSLGNVKGYISNNWVHAKGLKAKKIATNGSAMFALSETGEVFEWQNSPNAPPPPPPPASSIPQSQKQEQQDVQISQVVESKKNDQQEEKILFKIKETQNSPLSAQSITISDPNFAAKIRAICPNCIDTSNALLPAASTLTSLDLSSSNITSLAGIEGFIFTERLWWSV